jgi:hypothetical protein
MVSYGPHTEDLMTSIISKQLYVVTEYGVAIKTAPHADWFCPQGWGPYYSEQEGREAVAKADKLWMAARLDKTLVERELTSAEAADLAKQGVTVNKL